MPLANTDSLGLGNVDSLDMVIVRTRHGIHRQTRISA